MIRDAKNKLFESAHTPNKTVFSTELWELTVKDRQILIVRKFGSGMVRMEERKSQMWKRTGPGQERAGNCSKVGMKGSNREKRGHVC